MNDKVTTTTRFEPFPEASVAAKVQASQPKYALPPARPKGSPPLPRAKVTINNNPQPQKPKFDPVTSQMDVSAVKAYQEHIAKIEAEASPMVEVPPNNTITPVSDSEYSSLALPSSFAFYKFKDLYVKPFKVKQLAKMSRAHKEASLLPMVEAVSDVIYTTTPGFEKGLAFHLTLPDFYFILYWLRTNCFTKTVYNHKTECRNPEHMLEVAEGKKPRESMRIVQQIRNTDLQVKNLEVMPDPQVFMLTDPALYMKPCTVLDTLELVENTNLQDKEFQYLAELAVYFQSIARSLNLDERVEMLGDMNPDDAELIKEYTTLCNDYGVTEKITLTCPGCGASVETKLSIEAHDFLPSA